MTKRKPKTDGPCDAEQVEAIDSGPAFARLAALDAEWLAELLARCEAIREIAGDGTDQPAIDAIRRETDPEAKTHAIVELIDAQTADSDKLTGWLGVLLDRSTSPVIGPYMADVMRHGTVRITNAEAVEDICPDQFAASGVRQIARLLNSIR